MQGKIHEARTAACSCVCSRFHAKRHALPRFLILPLKSRSLQRCTYVHSIPCKYAHMSTLYPAKIYVLIEILPCQWLQRKYECLGASNSDGIIPFPFSATFSVTLPRRQMLGHFSPATESWAPQYLGGFVSLSLSSKIPPHCIWSCEDKHIRSVWYRYTVVLGVTKVMPAVSEGLFRVQSVKHMWINLWGSGPECINFRHSHPAKSFCSNQSIFLPGTTQPISNHTKAEFGSATTMIWFTGAPARLTVHGKWRHQSASFFSLKCCY